MLHVIPETPTELEEMLLDRKRIAGVVADDAAWGEFHGKYVKAFERKDKGETEAQIREQVERQVKDILDQQDIKRLSLAPGKGDPRHGAGYNPAAPGAAIDSDWKSVAEYLKATWHQTIAMQGLDERLKKDFSSVIGADGGFLIPETLRSNLFALALESAIVRPRATVIPMETLRVPFPTIDDTSHASSLFGGIIAYWTEEGATLTESQASFGRVVLEAHELTAYCEVPNSLIADSILSFEAFINRAYPEAIAWFEDYAFMRGNGAGEPLGTLNAGCLISVTKETGQAATSIVWENIVKAYARMLPSSQGRAIWTANHDTFPQLAVMSLAVGTGGSAVWLNNGTQGPPMSILGRPVIFTEKLPTLGTVGDLMFNDFSYYLLGDRQAVSMASSPHFKFQNNQTAYRMIERVDGRPWVQTALTPRAGSTLSPFVAVATRA